MNGSKHALPKPHAMALSYAALDFNFTSWMTPDNLRVLTSEQSSGSLKELAKQKDHLKSVVRILLLSSPEPEITAYYRVL